MIDFEEDNREDKLDPAWIDAAVVTKPGDLWQLGSHRLLCGDARDPSDLARLMDGGAAAMAFLDPPYNVRVRDIVGRGRVKHPEFALNALHLRNPARTLSQHWAISSSANG